MKPWDRTTMGGTGNQFKTTQWSRILSAKTKNETRRRMILNNLTETYWKPVYCYLRSKGFDNDAAKDLTQDFFSEIVLGRDLIQSANQLKGRFRTFLLVALDRYVVSAFRRTGRIKRGGQVNITKLDFADLANIQVLESMQSPDQAFYYGWIANLIEQVLEDVKNEYCNTMRASHWEAFRLRLLEPILNDTSPPRMAEVCCLCKIENESKASNMIETVKRRFRSVLKRHLRDLAGSDEEAEEEFQDIFGFLSGQCAR